MDESITRVWGQGPNERLGVAKFVIVGAGPAGLAAAHRLALLGHDVVLFEARAKLGGLNEYGLASYKTTNGFAQKEVDWLLAIGGIEVRTGQVLGRDITVDGLVAGYDAVFLGLGLAGVNFQQGDIIWVVGEEADLQKIQEKS